MTDKTKTRGHCDTALLSAALADEHNFDRDDLAAWTPPEQFNNSVPKGDVGVADEPEFHEQPFQTDADGGSGGNGTGFAK